MRFCVLTSAFIAVFGLNQAYAKSYPLSELEALALRASPNVLAAQAQVRAAEAGVVTASAFPNPELEVLQGNSRARLTPAPTTGTVQSITVTQPLDLWQRSSRIATAESGVNVAEGTRQIITADLIARLRTRFYELLRRQAEERASKEDQELMAGIRNRIAIRVETGEAPRYELVKADAELLNAQKVARSASLRAQQARLSLRALVGAQLDEDFEVTGRLADVPKIADLSENLNQASTRNPDLVKARAEKGRAEQQLAHERVQRLPQLALKAAVDQDPELRSSRLGFALTIPLWNQRQGQIGEASANLERANHELAQQEFALQQGLAAAYQQYQIAEEQVKALESGIVKQAEHALKIAEAAYRFGERGFLDVLDAQRVYRAARNELIVARYELAQAWVEIERWRSSQ